MRNLKKFIKREFPMREIFYRHEKFLFLSDLPVKYMEEYTNSDLKGIDMVKYLLHVFSYKPKLTYRVLDSMPSTMLMELKEIVFPKKAKPTSPNSTLISSTLPKSSVSPEVKLEIGDITKSAL